MRVVAVVVLAIAVCSCRAHGRAHNDLQRLLTAIGIKERSPAARLVHCARAMGPAKCASALGAWRAGKAVEAFSKRHSVQFNLTADVERFPWERYENVSDEVLYSQLNDRTQKLLMYRPMSLTLPGLEFRLKSNGFGKLNVDVIRRKGDDSETETSRGEEIETGRMTKKFRKQFYQILPFLVIPGLIIYAVLPLILPSLKMMTMASGLINSLALTGAVYAYLKRHGTSSSSQEDNKVTIIDVSYGNNGKQTPYYSASSQNYKAVEPNNMHFNEDLSQEYQNEWSNQNFIPAASQQSLQFATENSLLTSYLNLQQQPKIRIAYPSLIQQKAEISYPVSSPIPIGIKYPNSETQGHEPIDMNYPNYESLNQKIGITYPNEQIHHGVELSYVQTMQPEPAISYSTEQEIPDIGIDLNQNQLPHIDGLDIQNGELQQKMEMSYLKGLQDQQVRIANEQSKKNLDTSYPIDQLDDLQIRRSGDGAPNSSEEISSSTEYIASSTENTNNTNSEKQSGEVNEVDT